MSEKSRADTIRATVGDMVSCLLYYDRKEDEDLPVGAIEEAIRNNEITTDEIVNIIRTQLERSVET